MARRKRRGGRRGMIPKTAGGWVSLGFKLGGAAIALGPAIQSIDIGTPANIPKNLLYNYTGYSVDSASLNPGQLGVGVASIVGGILIAKAGSMLGRIIH